MKIVYRAENAIDANLVKGLLEQAGIMAFVNGAYLQGGVGELPASGLISVSVADEEVEAAARIIDQFQQDTADQTGADQARPDPSDELLGCED